MNRANSGQTSFAASSGRSRPRALTRGRFTAVCALLAVLGICFGATLGFLLSQQHKPLFEARAVLATKPSGPKSGADGAASDVVSAAEASDRVVEAVGGYPMASRVVRRLGLTTDPDFARAARWNDAVRGPLLAADAAAVLGRMRDVSARREEGLVDIRVRTTDAGLSKRLANAFAEECPKMLVEEGAARVDAASRLLDAEAHRLEERMRLAEQSLQNIKEREDDSPDQPDLDAAQSAIEEGKATLARLQEVIRQLDSDLLEVGQSGGDTDILLKLPSVAEDPRVAELKTKIAAVENGSSDGNNQPDLLREKLSSLAIEVVGQLETRRARAEDEVTELQAKLTLDERQLVRLTGRSVARGTLERNLEADRKLLESVLASRKRLESEATGENARVSVREYAETTTYLPSGSSSYTGLGALAGLLAALGGVFFWHHRNPFLANAYRAQAATGLAVVASVPGFVRKHGDADEVSSLFPAVQCFRALAQEIPSRLPAAALPTNRIGTSAVILIASAADGEGKTFASCNLAAALAQSGLRTLLIDGNLRDPAASQLLCAKDCRTGLAEVLSGAASLQSAVCKVALPGLSVLPAGSSDEDPSALLGRPELRQMMKDLRLQFERIVIDAPALSGARDALRLCSVADASLLVVCADSTRAHGAREAVRILAESDAPPAGVVVNKAP